VEGRVAGERRRRGFGPGGLGFGLDLRLGVLVAGLTLLLALRFGRGRGLFAHGPYPPAPNWLGFGALTLFRPSRSWHKTSREMNASPPLFVNALKSAPAARGLACACAVALLGGCMGNPFAT